MERSTLAWIGAAGVLGWLVLRDRKPDEPASSVDQPTDRYSPEARDIMAAARMIASENPSAPEQAKVEQIHAELRARKPGQSLYDRITGGGHGWGPQGKGPDGHSRPVSTRREAKSAEIDLAKEVLAPNAQRG